jgi:hypothetical protein
MRIQQDVITFRRAMMLFVHGVAKEVVKSKVVVTYVML